jgi:uncharacterized membrane protein (DUF485 family)
MSEERVEEKSREIGEAAHEYAYTRLRNWMPVAIMAAIAVGVYAVTQHAGSSMMQHVNDRSEVNVERLAEQAKRAAFISVQLQCVGTAAAAWLGWWVLKRWRFGDSSVVTVPQQETEAGSPETAPRLRERARFVVEMALVVVISFFGFRLLFQSSPRFQPLVVSSGLTLLMLKMLLEWRLDSRRTGGDSSGPVVGVTAANLYALAIAAGLPRPFAGTSEDISETLGVFAPVALLFLCWVIGDAIYSRRQFRRLQRLVNEDPPREEKRDG